MLSGGELSLSGRRLMWMLILFGDVVIIAGLELA
jgi:hypothetical protein